MNTFQGFTPETIDFLWELKMNNNREWMEQNRERYRSALKEPFDAFCAALSQCYFTATGEKREWSVSRINRDIRFSKDKSPYRSCRWVVLKEPELVGVDWKIHPAFYFELSAQGYTHGMGFYECTPAYLKAFREKITANSAQFQRIVQGLTEQCGYVLDGEDYKRRKDEGLSPELARWYNKKAFSVNAYREIEEILFTAKLPEMLVEQWKVLLPLYDFLRGIRVDG